MNWNPSKERFDKLKEQTTFNSPEERLLRNLYLSFYSFSGTRQSYSEKGRNRGVKLRDTLEDIQNILKGVKIYNKDYKKVVRQYDNPKALIYFDPPYTGMGHYYEGRGIDPYELSGIRQCCYDC